MLSDLGIRKDWTYETIITCYNDDLPHAAPFGIKSPDMKIIQIEMYKGSITLASILDKNEFVVNFVSDPVYFYHSLYNRDQLGFTEAKNVKAPIIGDCPAFMEAKIINSVEKAQSFLFDAEIVHIEIVNTPRLINRAESLVIESLIIATRVDHMPEGRAAELLKENHRIIKKVAPGSRHVDIMENLLNKCSILK